MEGGTMRILVRQMNVALLGSLLLLLSPVASQAKKAETTGKCVCKKGSNVLATYDAKICTTVNHDGCTAAKKQCVTDNKAACTGLGGILTQSGAACTIGAKC
jgi:hypothetical protein